MPRPTTHPFRVYAHRGACTELPENTLPAFLRALEHGVDALETDVHVTRDGEVVVHHDKTATWSCGVDVPIAAVDLDTVKSWDAGHSFVGPSGERPFVGAGYEIPTLGELLTACPSVMINVDIKAHDRRAVRKVIEVITAHDAADRVLVTSANDRVSRWARHLRYPGPTGLGKGGCVQILATPAFMLARMRVRADALQIPWQFGGRSLARRWVVDRAHAAGVRVDYWTVNDPEVAVQLVALGADGVMTDDPALIVPTVRRARVRLGLEPT